MGTRRNVLVLVAALALVAAVSLTLVVRHHRDRTFFCADVGLRGPSAATPDRALAAFVEPSGGHGSEWKGEKSSSHGASSSYVFTPTHAGVIPRLKSISVSGRDHAWHADGGCV